MHTAAGSSSPGCWEGVAGRPRALAEAARPGPDGPLLKEHKAADKPLTWGSALEGEPQGHRLRGARPKAAKGGAGPDSPSSPGPPRPQGSGEHAREASREEPAPMGESTICRLWRPRATCVGGLLATSSEEREAPHCRRRKLKKSDMALLNQCLKASRNGRGGEQLLYALFWQREGGPAPTAQLGLHGTDEDESSPRPNSTCPVLSRQAKLALEREGRRLARHPAPGPRRRGPPRPGAR